MAENTSCFPGFVLHSSVVIHILVFRGNKIVPTIPVVCVSQKKNTGQKYMSRNGVRNFQEVSLDRDNANFFSFLFFVSSLSFFFLAGMFMLLMGLGETHLVTWGMKIYL